MWNEICLGHRLGKGKLTSLRGNNAIGMDATWAELQLLHEPHPAIVTETKHCALSCIEQKQTSI